MLRLQLKREPTVPLEAEVISPDNLSTLSLNEIGEQTVYHGKRQLRLDEFFSIEGDPSDVISIQGDLTKVRWVGRQMTRGRIAIEGDVGMHLGSRMRGGTIEVHGNASDWVGAEMRNGTIRIHGNAGGQIGAGYRGSMSGMRNGVICVDGDAGLEVGLRMRRGTIVIGGLCRDFAGLQMKGGTILLRSGAEIRTGAWMNRGTIISLRPLQLMPTFVPTGVYRSPFLTILGKYLSDIGVEFPHHAQQGSFQRFVGDTAVPGKGEILVWNPA